MAKALSTTPTEQASEPYLEMRGLAHAAIKAGWKLNKSGNYRVPIYYPGYTLPAAYIWYNIPESREKYKGKTILQGKPDNLHYYLLPGAIEAIQAANGTCYWASGLTDTLAYIAAGIANIIAPLGGENSIPDTLAADLVAFGVNTLINFPDKDKTGNSSADKIAQKLVGSGVNYAVKDLPGNGKDIADLWEQIRKQLFEQFGETAVIGAFHATINNAPNKPIVISPSPVKSASPAKAVQPTTVTIDYGAIQTAILQALGLSGEKPHKTAKGDAYSLRCIEPASHNNGDQNPSAALYTNSHDTGLFVYVCSACGLTLWQIDLCNRFNIALPKSDKPDNAAVQPLALAQLTNLPLELILAMLQKKQANMARFLYALFSRANLLADKALTVKEIYDIVQDSYPSELAVRRVINQLGTFYHECTLEEIFSFVSNYGNNHDKNSSPSNRPPKQYRFILTPQKIYDLCKYYRVKPINPVTIPSEAWKSAKAFSNGVHLAYIQINQDKWMEKGYYPPTGVLAKENGRCKRTLLRNEKQLIEDQKLDRIPRYSYVPTSHNYSLSKEEKAKGLKRIFISPSGEWLIQKPKTSKRSIPLPKWDEVIEDAIALGATVTEL